MSMTIFTHNFLFNYYSFSLLFLIQGTKFEFKDDWGEQLVSKCCPVLVRYDVTTDDIKVLDGVPDHLSAGQVGKVMSQEGMIFFRVLKTLTYMYSIQSISILADTTGPCNI